LRRFYLFRSNLRIFEYYHKFRDLETFRKNCHDYYLLFSLWLLEKDYFDEVVIWRLYNKQVPDIVFEVNGKRFIQRWVQDFRQVANNYPKCDVSFWRGGFPEYDSVTKQSPKHFGFKVYLGAGRRVFPRWNGKYDLFLVEDERDLSNQFPCAFFYKTASPYLFFPTDVTKKWDICWPCNFTQLRYKGQREFIRLVSESKFLRKLKIVHCGNKPEVGQRLCQKYGVDNITFLGYKSRSKLNEILNHSKFGLNFSNRLDGCPRVSTEILMSGTPLLISEQTRLLNYYKKFGVVVLGNNCLGTIQQAFARYGSLTRQLQDALSNELSFDIISRKNVKEWLTF